MELSCLWPIKNTAAAPIRLGSPAQPRRSPPPTPAAVDRQLPSAGKDSWVRRRIMVAVAAEGGRGALEWALSHSIHSRSDSIILLTVVEPTRFCKCEKCAEERNARRYQMLYAMQNMCHAMRPEIKVEISVVEGSEQGPAIVAEARRRMASLLVLGQKSTKSISWSSLAACAGNGVGGGVVVDYCIQNAPCMTLAVRTKSRRGGGGYLITSKHHKNFWLLA